MQQIGKKSIRNLLAVIAIAISVFAVLAMTACSEPEVLTDLPVGTEANLDDDLVVTVNSFDTGVKGSDGEYTRINVTYTNNGSKDASFNEYDWMGQDSSGVNEDCAIYWDEDYNSVDTLSSGSISAGSSVTGDIYFEGTLAKALYYDNSLMDDECTASWVLE